MSQHFFIIENGQQYGPFSIEDLKIKNIKRDTLVWTEGLDNWVKAEDLPQLKDIIQKIPPPLPNLNEQQKTVSTPPPFNSDFTKKYFGYTLAGRRERLFASLFQTFIIAFPIFLLFSNDISNDIRNSSNDSFGSVIGGIIISTILGAIVYPIWGGNLGHKIMGLNVISSENGAIQNKAKDGALREFYKSATSWLFLPMVWLLWDDNCQNLYDKFSKTYVVKKKEEL